MSVESLLMAPRMPPGQCVSSSPISICSSSQVSLSLLQQTPGYTLVCIFNRAIGKNFKWIVSLPTIPVKSSMKSRLPLSKYSLSWSFGLWRVGPVDRKLLIRYSCSLLQNYSLLMGMNLSFFHSVMNS